MRLVNGVTLSIDPISGFDRKAYLLSAEDKLPIDSNSLDLNIYVVFFDGVNPITDRRYPPYVVPLHINDEIFVFTADGTYATPEDIGIIGQFSYIAGKFNLAFNLADYFTYIIEQADNAGKFDI